MRLRSRDVLIEFLDGAGLSERELARRAGLSHSTVNHLLTGRRRGCSLSTALAIERALDAPPGAVFRPDTDNEQNLLVQYAESVRPSRRH
ncbi:MAG TPA: helix-turn-helix transcriptional regulator [Jatrophihabitans sp.]|nr:helix-turn-helix transcriptional regulator [Jatrophihabitans sp.]